MGRVARWLRSLLGGGKKEQNENRSGSDRKEQKKRWSFGKSSGNDNVAGGEMGRQIPADGWLRPYREAYYTETEKEQNKHAIAVAAATAAAADAAVAAAQAAVAVVRLTSHGRGTLFGGRERWAAIKIQTVFRGYLAKKALRALKGLVKLQALVRGYLVRKQAAATFYSMQALIRAQATVRTQKGHSGIHKDHRYQPENRPRRSIERFDDSRSENTSSFHSRRLSASLDPITNAFEESPKIVEIDTCRPKSRSRRTINSVSDSGEENSNLPSSSPLPCQIPARLSVPDGWNPQDLDWGLTGEECRFSTAQSTPRFANSGGSIVGVPVTPAKSVCAESFFRRYSNFPNYMANTQSFRAKVRSQSAPKQRPEPAPRKRLTLNEAVMESRASLSGVRMQRSCSQVQEAFSFKNAVLNKMDRSQELGREAERDYLHRRW